MEVSRLGRERDTAATDEARRQRCRACQTRSPARQRGGRGDAIVCARLTGAAREKPSRPCACPVRWQTREETTPGHLGEPPWTGNTRTHQRHGKADLQNVSSTHLARAHVAMEAKRRRRQSKSDPGGWQPLPGPAARPLRLRAGGARGRVPHRTVAAMATCRRTSTGAHAQRRSEFKWFFLVVGVLPDSYDLLHGAFGQATCMQTAAWRNTGCCASSNVPTQL